MAKLFDTNIDYTNFVSNLTEKNKIYNKLVQI